MDNNDLKFSVCIPVYYKEKVDNLRACLDSMVKQTRLPNEILLLTDDPSTAELDHVIKEYESTYPGLFMEYSLPRGSGLGRILQNGVMKSKYELIARMDADDIAEENRFELQINEFRNNPDLSIVGGNIAEFSDDAGQVIGYRTVPYSDVDCKEFLKKRNPFNHMTVMFKRGDVLRSGNYPDFMKYYEDYYLWVSMCISGCEFKNIDKVLVKARTGEGMYARRGGLGVYQYDKILSKYKHENGIVDLKTYLMNNFIRFTVFVVMPISVRKFIYETFLRKRALGV